MNKTLILISKTPIVVQIFTLVCKKLNIRLEVLKEAQIDHKVDITVVDKNLIDDRFNILKTYSKQIGAISNKELSFEMANNFLIPLPFLPSTLESILDEQLQIIRKKEKSKTYISNVPASEIDESLIQVNHQNTQELEPAIDYLENLAEDIAHDVKGETDESIVSISSIENQGGILDTTELSKIESMFSEDDRLYDNKEKDFIKNDNDDDGQWHDLSSIIDDAINEVNATSSIYDKFDNKPIKVLLNNYSLTELTPLLNLLDQEIINTLTDGYEVTVQLKLGNTDG